MKLDSGVTLVRFVNHLAAVTPKMLKKREPEFSFTLLSHWLGKELAIELLSTLNEIRLELVPRHADDLLLVNAFWDDIVCEVAANHQRFCEGSQAASDLIKEFGDRWKQPLSELEIIYALDYLKIGKVPIVLLGVEFFAPTDATLAERSIPKSVVDGWSKDLDFLTLAILTVEASSSYTAFETGRKRVIEALSLMKASALWGLAGKINPDEFLQWKVSGHYIVKPVTATQQFKYDWGIQRQLSPIVIEMGNYIRQGIEGLGIDLLSDIPRDISERIIHSLNWITYSTTHESDDHKLVDLCTALEILLLPEGPQIKVKGTVIALRYNLLGGQLNPSAVKWMYDRRNEVIHGSPLPVVAQQDTWHLRLVCYTTVDLIARTSAGQPNVSTLKDLITTTVETKENLKTFLERSENGTYKGSSLPKLVSEAKKRLRNLNK